MAETIPSALWVTGWPEEGFRRFPGRILPEGSLTPALLLVEEMRKKPCGRLFRFREETMAGNEKYP